MLSASSKSFQSLILLCLFLITSCGHDSRTSPSVSTASTTPTLPSQTVEPAYTPGPFPTFASLTPSSTQLPAGETIGRYEVVLRLMGDDAQPVWGARNFAISPDSCVWIEDYHYPGRLLEYSPEGKLIREIPRDGEHYILDMDVTDSGIWLLEVAALSNDTSYVTHLGLDGTLLHQYDIPKKFYIGADGQYIDVGLGSIEWGGDGELLLQTGTGLHQLLDGKGNLIPIKAIAGYPAGGRVYRVENWTNGSHSGALIIDNKRITISTAMENIFLKIGGFASDGSLYLEVYEFSGRWTNSKVEAHLTVRHYSRDGELLGIAQVPEVALKSEAPPTNLGADRKMYTMVSFPDHSVQVLRLIFEPVQ